MVTLTRLNGSVVVINAEMIEMLETTPDTVVTLTNGRKYVVKEPVEDVVNKVVDFRRRTLKDLIYYREEAGS